MGGPQPCPPTPEARTAPSAPCLEPLLAPLLAPLLPPLLAPEEGLLSDMVGTQGNPGPCTATARPAGAATGEGG